jgi:hypothetical protein
MIDPFLMKIIIAVVAGVVVIVLAWLIRTHLKLKYEYQALAEFVHGHNNDIANLCAAAQTTDRYLAAMDEQISDLSAKISNYQHNDSSTLPYNLIIQKVRSGANVSELMQNSGLSQDEAALLIRLHGSKTQ